MSHAEPTPEPTESCPSVSHDFQLSHVWREGSCNRYTQLEDLVPLKSEGGGILMLKWLGRP